MNRIVILGCAGSGKTTLARRLAEKTAAPLVCLDEIWGDLGKESLGRFREILTEAHLGDAWVSDGDFALATFDIRLPRADLVIWLDRPRLSCAWRAAARVVRRSESHRPRDLLKVLRFIWGFERINRPRIEAARAQYGPSVPVVRLRNDREIAAFLQRSISA